MPPTSYVHIVMASGIVFGVYQRASWAHAHARTILGASVVSCEILEWLPNSVLDDIGMEDDYAEDTLRIEVPFDDLERP